MPDFWLDSDSLVTPYRGPYRFSTVPRFWDFLEQKAEEQVVASSYYVLRELTEGDELEVWAKRVDTKLFLIPDDAVTRAYSLVVNNVMQTQRYAAHHVAAFLDGADPWIIAHALAKGGRVVTFEKPEPMSSKPKIPDVASGLGINCINVYDMLTMLGASF